MCTQASKKFSLLSPFARKGVHFMFILAIQLIIENCVNKKTSKIYVYF